MPRPTHRNAASSDPARFARRTTPAAPARRRAKVHADRAASARSDSSGRDRSPRSGDPYPGWRDLTDANLREPGGQSERWTLVNAIPTFRFAFVVLAIGLGLTLYVGHVLATQDLMARAETLRRENLALHLRANRIKGAFDQASGPAVIYERARALGLSQHVPNGQAISVD